MTFGVDPDTHIDSLEQAEHATVEGTSKWSCKLIITGTQQTNINEIALMLSFRYKKKHFKKHIKKLTTKSNHYHTHHHNFLNIKFNI